jgi:hypothetical protein
MNSSVHPLGQPASAWAAAQALVAVQTHYARSGRTLAHAVLAGAGSFHTDRHYPRGDVIDPAQGSQFYYHAHAGGGRQRAEHGHFHHFAREPDAPGAAHLLALSLDTQGWPLRWFCTNRWVTGGPWWHAEQALAALAGFKPVARGRLAPVARWLGALVALYLPTLATLLARRDRLLTARLRSTPAQILFEDRRLDVITATPMSLPQRLGQLAGHRRT